MHAYRAPKENRTMKKTLFLAAAAAATLFTVTAANASRVDWSIGINLPPVSTVVASPGYGYYAQPVYPASTYYAPTYYDAAPAYAPAPVYYPPRVIYAPRYAPRGYGWGPAPIRYWRGGHDRWHHDGGRVERGHGGRDHDGRSGRR
jgi:hypothetical protein